MQFDRHLLEAMMKMTTVIVGVTLNKLSAPSINTPSFLCHETGLRFLALLPCMLWFINKTVPPGQTNGIQHTIRGRVLLNKRWTTDQSQCFSEYLVKSWQIVFVSSSPFYFCSGLISNFGNFESLNPWLDGIC
uniref:Uncharacterized protein n=1 Tax=Cucumis melo TaxID=3656 RepID=A0A9I9EGJ7_CUCME